MNLTKAQILQFYASISKFILDRFNEEGNVSFKNIENLSTDNLSYYKEIKITCPDNEIDIYIEIPNKNLNTHVTFWSLSNKIKSINSNDNSVEEILDFMQELLNDYSRIVIK